MDRILQDTLGDLVSSLVESYNRHSIISNIDSDKRLDRAMIIKICDAVRQVLFPGYFEYKRLKNHTVRYHVGELLENISYELTKQVEKALDFVDGGLAGADEAGRAGRSEAGCTGMGKADCAGANGAGRADRSEADCAGADEAGQAGRSEAGCAGMGEADCAGADEAGRAGRSEADCAGRSEAGCTGMGEADCAGADETGRAGRSEAGCTGMGEADCAGADGAGCAGCANGRNRARAEEIVDCFLHRLLPLRDILAKDVQAAYDGDPAAFSTDEVIFSYPGLHAITVYRIAHELHILGAPMIPRIMTEYAHSLTGIDIHPGAQIGEYFFIDHGTGVVIGETTVIGKNVKIYQGVTLGGLSTRGGQSLRNKKRHPTLKDNVTVYAGASILGGETVIGEGAVIGSNAFITSSVPDHTRVSIKNPELQFKVRGSVHTQELGQEGFFNCMGDNGRPGKTGDM